MTDIPVKIAYLDFEFKIVDRNKEFFSAFEKASKECFQLEELVRDVKKQELTEFLSKDPDPNGNDFILMRFMENDGEYHFHAVYTEDTFLYNKPVRMVKLYDIAEINRSLKKLSSFNTKNIVALSITKECFFIYERQTNLIKIFHYIQNKINYIFDMDIDQWKKMVVRKNLIDDESITSFIQKTEEIKNCPDNFHASLKCGLRTGSSVMENLVFTGVKYVQDDQAFVIGRIIPDEKVEELEEAAALLEELQIDSLTQVYNKKTIIEYVNKRLESGARGTSTFAIIDLDHFKPVNDAYGHLAGDRVLTKTGKLLKEIVGNQGVVGRYGGDEFVVLVDALDSENSLRGLLRTINVGIKNCFEDDFPDIKISASIGSASFPNDGTTLDELFKKADFCLYRAKDKGRDRYVFFREDLHGELYRKAILDEAEGIKYDDREILELKSMSEFMQNLSSAPYAAVKNVLEHMLETYNLGCINIYYGEGLKRVYHAGTKAKKLSNAEYVYTPAFKKVLGEKSYIRIDFVSDMKDSEEELMEILTDRGIKSTIQCILGTPNNICGLITFDRIKEPALWAEYEVNCAVMFAAAFNLLPEATKVDFALYNKLKYS